MLPIWLRMTWADRISAKMKSTPSRTSAAGQRKGRSVLINETVDTAVPTKNASIAGPTAAMIGPENMLFKQVGRRGRVRAIQYEPADQHLAHEDRGDGCDPDQDEDTCGIPGGWLSLCREAGQREDAGNEQHHADEE